MPKFTGDVPHELRKIASAIRHGNTHPIDAERLEAIAKDLENKPLGNCQCAILGHFTETCLMHGIHLRL